MNTLQWHHRTVTKCEEKSHSGDYLAHAVWAFFFHQALGIRQQNGEITIIYFFFPPQSAFKFYMCVFFRLREKLT